MTRDENNAGSRTTVNDASRLELVLLATNEGHWDWDLVTDEVYFSPRWKEMLGYRADEISDHVDEWKRRLHPDDQPGVETALREFLEGERATYEIEHRLRHRDGTWRWIRTRGTALRDETGKAVRIVGAHQDITGRKRAEQDVRRRDAILDSMRFTAARFLREDLSWSTGAGEVLRRLGEATEVSRVYVFENVTGPDGELWAANMHQWSAPGMPVSSPELQRFSYREARFTRMMEMFRRGEILQTHVRDLPPGERQGFEAEGTLSFVLVPIFVDGEWWGFFGLDECEEERVFSAPEQDALKAAADTLGAAVARSRAAETSAWLAAIVESSEDAIFGLTLDGRIISWNQASARLYGYRADEMIGQSVALILPPDSRSRMDDVFAALRRGENLGHYESERVRKDGSRVIVSVSISPVRNHAGSVIGAAAITRDITDRVQARQMLEQRVAERTREIMTLLEVTASLASTLELQPLLRVILEQFNEVVDYTGAAIYLLEDQDHLRLLDYRGPLTRSELNWSWSLDIARHSREVIARREPVIIPDVQADTPLARAFREKAIQDLGEVPENIASWMGVPLLLRDRAIGVLAVDHNDVDAYGPHQAELALAFASQAAVAVENARLFEQAQGKAALEERQRLARELHDSVSQALFGIGLGARTARTVIENNPAKAIAPLDYVLSLAEAGLAEMRALIFELRPEALQEEGLIAALEKQVAALQARYGIAVNADLDEMTGLPLHIEEALYRIAQEAMHNTVKHARASQVDLLLTREARGIRLVVADNGKGFEATGTFPGHLGLMTMRDRAESLGGTLSITSAPGEGSRIDVWVPARDE